MMSKGMMLIALTLLLMLSACMREPVAVECRINRMFESYVVEITDAELCQEHYLLVKDVQFRNVYTNDAILRPSQLLSFSVSLTRGPERQYLLQSDGVISYYEGDRLKRGNVDTDVYKHFEQVLEAAKND